FFLPRRGRRRRAERGPFGIDQSPPGRTEEDRRIGEQSPPARHRPDGRRIPHGLQHGLGGAGFERSGGPSFHQSRTLGDLSSLPAHRPESGRPDRLLPPTRQVHGPSLLPPTDGQLTARRTLFPPFSAT